MQASAIARTVALFSLTVLLASAQEPVKTPLTPRIQTATRQVAMFTTLETRMLQAIQKKDKPALIAMLTDDFAVEMPSAERTPAEDWLDSVMSKDFTLQKFGVRQMSVVDLGNAVVVNFDRLQEAAYKGAPDTGQFFVVDLWRKERNGWKLASRYVSKVSSVVPASSDVKPTGKQ